MMAKVSDGDIDRKSQAYKDWTSDYETRYKDRDKAMVQRDKIRKSNIAAVFIEQFKIDNKPSFRVRLGPFINRDQTKVAQNKIKAKHDIDGIIMKYER